MKIARTTAVALVALAAHVATTLSARVACADERTLDDYRYFRALSIDLSGRIPTREELQAFEAPGFDLDAWIEAHLAGDAYVDRVRRIYMDALKLDVSTNFGFVPDASVLRRYSVRVAEPDGSVSSHWVYWRTGQLRASTALSRAFCFDASDTGQTYPRNDKPVPAVQPKPVPRAVFDARTSRVKPWWVYRDYRAAAPHETYPSWRAGAGRFRLDLSDRSADVADSRLLVDPDGHVAFDVAVCREEAQTAEKATASVRGVTLDVACNTEVGATFAEGCGCGPGLERCAPGAGFGRDPRAFVLPSLAPLGPAEPFEVEAMQLSNWWRNAWSEEARAFLGGIIGEDRDFREVLTARDGWMNGPTAQFYRAAAFDGTAEQLALGAGATYAKPEPIVDPAALPRDLLPFEMDRWMKVADRGPHAAGILTTAAFLAKYATRRGRAHAVYTAFQCRDFVAENLDLAPSAEPNLMIRPGCSTCHAALEPLAAYFTRVKESAFAWIPAPIENPMCTSDTTGPLANVCKRYYDPDFSTASAGQLRGAYGSPQHADEGPPGLGQVVASSPEFSSCAAERLTESFLGRTTTSPGDDALLASMKSAFEAGGHRMRALVRSIVKSDAYRHANSRLTGGGR